MTNSSTIDLARLAATDSFRAARLLQGVREAALSGQAPPVEPRRVIEQSWTRMLRSGVDPDRDVRAHPLSREEVEERRRASPLAEVMPVLREGLVSIADAAQHIMVVADADGRVLWREGHSSVLRKADGHGFELGADWRESTVGTNGIGTPLVTRAPVQVFSAEHFVRTHHSWTCAGAPVIDPRDGKLLGVVDISGPIDSMHPATLALVRSVTRLAEAELRNRHLARLDRLRALALPLLSRIDGRAVAVDERGWTAAVTGMAPADRIPLPKGLTPGPTWLASLGACTAEQLPGGGWLFRLDTGTPPPGTPAPGTRLTLDLTHPGRATVTVSGSARTGTWTHDLTPRHAELLYLLAAHPAGRSAAELAADMFGDPARTVTVRAELSRVRRYLAGLLEHRPYRFRDDVDVDVLLPEHRADLLPHSTAPPVRRLRASEPSGV